MPDAGASLWVPLAIGMGLLGAGGSYFMADEQQRRAESNAEDQRAEAEALQKRTQEEQAKLWKENAFPSKESVDQKRKEGMATLGTGRTNAYEDLARSLSVRGIGANSPFSGEGASNIEKGYMGGQASLINSLNTMENTPRFSFPFTGYAPNYGASAYSGMNSGSGAGSGLGMALGMMMANKGGNSGGVPALVPNSYDYGTGTNWYDYY